MTAAAILNFKNVNISSIRAVSLKFVGLAVRKIWRTVCVSINGPGDLLTLKLVCQSHQRCGTFLPNLGTLSLWVLELFAMYATDGQTDGRTDKSNAYRPLHYGRGLKYISGRRPGIVIT